MTEHAKPKTFVPIVPASAPFSAEQRTLLDRFFNDAFNLGAPQAVPAAAPSEDDDTPWHDTSLDMDARMALATTRPLPMRMMAAMAQQDCGQCGYNCRDYAKAITEQAEPRLNLCVPGGKATARMLKTLVEEMGGGVLDPDSKAAADAAAATAPPKAATSALGRSRDNPAEATFVSRHRLNGTGSEKTTNHIEIDLTASGLDYVVGDSLGIFPANDAALADAVIAFLGYPADFPIAGKSLRDVLIYETALGNPPDSLFHLISYLTGGERRKKAQALAKGQDPDGDAATLDVLAALQKFPGIRPDPEALMEVLEPLQPRLYSISSSIKANPGRVSLTVDTVRYKIDDRARNGVASTYFDERLPEGAPLRVYVQKAHGFALPDNPAVPIIMVGPGTGVAPFRAFLQERAAVQASGQASGKAWLFFGHQREASDYFYKDELTALSKSGTLTKLSLAWSRDGAKKTYVQDRMRDEGAEVFAWLKAGAHFYICGDAKRMARDVDRALVEIAMQHGTMDEPAALAFVKALKSDGRYQADVY
jgi:sulfite reductase (NADPH) flavoprotein alpha-component